MYSDINVKHIIIKNNSPKGLGNEKTIFSGLYCNNLNALQSIIKCYVMQIHY